MDIQTKDGILLRNIPDGTPDDVIKARIEKIRSDTNPDTFQGSAAGGVVQGARDMVDGGAQLLTHILPQSLVDAGNKANNWLADKTGLVGKLPDGGVDQKIIEDEKAYQQARSGSGREGMDLSRIGGNVLASLLLGGGKAPATVLGQIAKGGAQGGAVGALQPVTQGNFTEEKAKQVGVGASLGGALAPLGAAIGNATAKSKAQAEILRSQNATRDATLKAAQDAGYTIPRSLYNPSFLSNRLESLGGKAAVKQQAAANNQSTTNALARQYLGVADDAPLSSNMIDDLLKQKAGPYREASSLPSTYRSGVNTEPRASGAELVESIKRARDVSRAAWKSFQSGNAQNPTIMREQAEAADNLVRSLEGKLDDLAQKGGNKNLVASLREARKDIAKVHTIDKALNDATGDISAGNLSSQLGKNVPLTDEARTIAEFASAFPQVAQNGARIPTAGVSKSEALASGVLGTIGAATTGPVGMAAGALPLLSHPARALALSKLLQSSPQYGPGPTKELLAKLLASGYIEPASAAMATHE